MCLMQLAETYEQIGLGKSPTHSALEIRFPCKFEVSNSVPSLLYTALRITKNGSALFLVFQLITLNFKTPKVWTWARDQLCQLETHHPCPAGWHPFSTFGPNISPRITGAFLTNLIIATVSELRRGRVGEIKRGGSARIGRTALTRTANLRCSYKANY